jgi:hypothetical protein
MRFGFWGYREFLQTRTFSFHSTRVIKWKNVQTNFTCSTLKKILNPSKNIFCETEEKTNVYRFIEVDKTNVSRPNLSPVWVSKE